MYAAAKLSNRQVGLALASLWIAFIGRVTAQLLVYLGWVVWLPPMSSWMSGLMPYRFLLPAQVAIIAVYGVAWWDVWRGRGWFARSKPWFGRGLLAFGCLYFAAIIVRYVVHMVWGPVPGGMIPIVFHWVLSSFMILFALWHRVRLADGAARRT